MVHGHYTVNGKKVDIPSYLVKAGDVVAIKEGSRSSDKFKAVHRGELRPSRSQVAGCGRQNAQAKIVELPTARRSTWKWTRPSSSSCTPSNSFCAVEEADTFASIAAVYIDTWYRLLSTSVLGTKEERG